MPAQKILVIDDDPDFLNMIKARLEANLFKVLTAMDGMEGLIKAEDEKPNLIVLDVMMPNLDGHAFIQEIRRKESIKNIPIIISSGHADIQKVFRGEGIEHFLTKPFQSQEFLGMVRDILGETNQIEFL